MVEKFLKFMVAGVFFGLSLFMFYSQFAMNKKLFWDKFMPSAVETAVWLPEKFELQPSEKVEPGTFKIEMTFDEFKKTDGEKRTLVVYDQENSRIDYWRPADNGNYFYHSEFINDKSNRREISENSEFEWTTTFHKAEGGAAKFIYEPNFSWGVAFVSNIVFFLFGAMVFIIGIAALP